MHLLVERLSPVFDGSRNPLFDTLFVVQEGLRTDISVNSLTWNWSEWDHGTAKFDMTWVCTSSEQGMTIGLEFRTDLWKEETMQRMLGHYIHLLEQMLEHPQRTIAELELLTEAEKRELDRWNATQAEYPREQTVCDRFREQVARYGHLLAVKLNDDALTYRELDEASSRLASYLRGKGVRPGQKVGLLMERSIGMIVSIFAVIKAGGAYVPLDPTHPPERLAAILEDSEAGWLIVDKGARVPAFEGETIVYGEHEHESKGYGQETHGQDRVTDADLAEESTLADEQLTADHPLYIMYTSGSTGTPKGVVTTHRNVIKTSVNNGFADIGPGDRMLQLSNYAFDGSTYEIFCALLNGATLVLIRREDVLNAAALCRVLREERITSAFMTAALFNTVVDWDVHSLQHVRKLFFGGEAASKKHVLKALDALGPGRIANGYGPTETTVFAATYTVDESVREWNTVPIGRPIHNTKLYVLNRWGQRQPVGVAGELYIGGEGLAKGYLNRPDLTQEAFIESTFEFAPGERLYRTGDLVRWLPDGNLEYLGRLDRQVKIRGQRVELDEVEQCLRSLAGIRDAVVMANRDERGHSYLCAYVMARKERIAEWKNHLRHTLPDYMIPTAFILLDKLPLTSNGKVDRRALPVPEHLTRKHDYVAPTNETERKLAAVWEQVLDVERIGRNDHFFEMGGHSLKAMMLSGQVRSRFRCAPVARRHIPHACIETDGGLDQKGGRIGV